MWSWLSPGDYLEIDQAEDLSVHAKEDLSNDFSLLKIKITHVDQLILHKTIHIRKRWILKNEWIEECINP
tara:strand:- start:224 stop:433 length:210 start_codon:yes stop_codon:yes gene_type:complete